MNNFQVWAPRAERAEIVIDGHRHRMSKAERGETPGWWEVEVAEAGAGTRYQISIDGGALRPDPRSPYQPLGIDGPSQLVDHQAFVWEDQDWQGIDMASAVIYELHIGTFSPAGTFDGAVERLDHLVSLGVTAIELLPVAQASGTRGWGYDGVDLWAAHHSYGGPEGLKRLINAAHLAGMAVIIDVVYNHLGPAGNYLAEFGPYFTDRYSTPWGSAVNYDGEGSDEVRRFVIDNACMWLKDYHADGLRLDAIHAIMDQSALHVLSEMSQAVAQLESRTGRRTALIAESDRNDPAVVSPMAAGGLGLDATWSDDFHHALHSALSGEVAGYYQDYGTLEMLARTLEKIYAFGRDYSVFRNRHHGLAIPEWLPNRAFLGYSQNHDQIGNRARGDRLCHLVSRGRSMAAAALGILGPWVPMLFQGEEWAASTPWMYFTDHQDPELARAVTEGRRGEFSAFGWKPEEIPDPQALSTFEQSKLAWEEIDQPEHREMLEWYRGLLDLRQRYAQFSADSREAITVDFDQEEGWLWMDRGGLRVTVNLGSRSKSFPQARQILLASHQGIDPQSPDLPPDSVAIMA